MGEDGPHFERTRPAEATPTLRVVFDVGGSRGVIFLAYSILSRLLSLRASRRSKSSLAMAFRKAYLIGIVSVLLYIVCRSSLAFF